MMRADEGERLARTLFIKAGVESPGLCARLIMARATGRSKLACALEPEYELSSDQSANFLALCLRCEKGEPLAYILGKKEFYEHEFLVAPATLVPRPETEMLVELALKLPLAPHGKLIDLGCGSGCIGLSLAAKLPDWRIFLLDKSMAALKIARQNARNLGLNANILQGDLFGAPLPHESMDLVISNPPYIALSEQNEVRPTVLAHEPHMALFSSGQGLDHIKGVIDTAKRVLKAGGSLVFEHGASQAEKAAGMLCDSGFANIENYRDFAGLPRCMVAQKP